MHWSEDQYWTAALDRFYEARVGGKQRITIDLDKIDRNMYASDGPAFRLMEAMVSVRQDEGEDGYRGASRLVFALLQILGETSEADTEDDEDEDAD